MATDKPTPATESVLSTDEQILSELQTLNQTMTLFSGYIERMDWKLWTIMSMMKIIGEENGYRFTEIRADDKSTSGEFE
jgi:hypothetical protein